MPEDYLQGCTLGNDLVRVEKQLEVEIVNEVVEKWLSSDDSQPCYFRSMGNNYALISIEKNPDFVYLFSQNLYRGKSIESGSYFRYVGVYCRKDGLIYDAKYELAQIGEVRDSLKERSAESLHGQLRESVCKKVENMLGNDKGNLNITSVTDERLLERVEDLHQYIAKQTARNRYLDMDDWQTPAYHCHYVPEPWDEDSLLAYILEAEAYAEREARTYLADNQETILYAFLKNEAIEEEYQALMADTENLVHTIKKIMTAVRAAVGAKMVSVTIRKDGMEFTFKTKADCLRKNCGEYYRTYDIVADDRRRFKEFFGKYASYTPKEIVCITYAKKELYRVEG